ncbi:MAG: formate dehydrogenase accessory protein FdhE [Candidatus Rokubacteria bacterium]|nr:formate dehydrogenase accessory protein FdhE [Candidatus Rokubacteria bacterium]
MSAYDAILDGWAVVAPRVAALREPAARCHAVWARGLPLLAHTPPSLRRDDVEPLLETAMAGAVAVAPADATALDRFAAAWDEARVGPDDLLPGKGRLGSARAHTECSLRSETIGFLAVAALRPALGEYFSLAREHVPDRTWELGICPYCGAPPGFADIGEDGQRALACHLCGGAWTFSRTRCPFCGSDATSHLARLELGDREEGYVITGCRGCSAYVKELDRRTRWNGGPALAEDWGSPHFDLAARRHGFWRPVASLLDLAPDS